jgi:hypothetical protein
MNANSTVRTDGDDSCVTNKRKRCDDGNVDALGERFGRVELLGEIANNEEDLDGGANGGASLSTMPASMLLHIFSFVLARDQASIRPKPHMGSLKLQLTLEKTCHKFSALLGKDSTMRLLYQSQEEHLQFDHRVESLREKLFIANGIRLIRRFQKSTATLICNYMGGADGVRRVIDDMLTKMEQPCDRQTAYGRSRTWGDIMRPPQFPQNGFKLFLRGDSIAYLTEVIEQHMVYILSSAMSAALFRSNPSSSHPYPMVCEHDILFVDSIRTSDFGAFHSCVVCRHGSARVSHCCSRLSFSETPKIWKWPDDNCMVDDVIGAEQRQRMVRAIASRAGIVKLTCAAFDSIAAEILHFMATIVIDAFEVSKSLWCPHANVGCDCQIAPYGRLVLQAVAIDDEIIDEESDDDASISSDNYLESNHFANQPPPLVTVDEEGRHVCVVIPRQIKDAAVRLGMKPLLDSQSWAASEGRTKKEEVNEALSSYDLSLDDESSSSEESSFSQSLDDESSSSEVGSDSESVRETHLAEMAAFSRMLEELWNETD